MKTLRLSLVASALAVSLGLSGMAQANTTSSSIKGYVTGPQNNPAAGTVVTITHVPSGTSKTATVGSNGLFSAQGLRVGGPYRVTFDSNTLADKTVNNVYLTLGETFQLNQSLKSEQVEVIEVSGQLVTTDMTANSPSTTFDLDDLEVAPSTSRDIKDLVRVDPRVYVNEFSSTNSVNCAGSNPRYNSLTVDGVRMNDNFGLNGNGYPTERIPFSFDAIDQVAVELAPFNVQYGGFTACNINAVTKSGGNEIHGGVFMDFTSDEYKGNELEGAPVPQGNYTEKRYGFNVGMPIIEDTLFFFAAYEELEGAQIFQYTPLTDTQNQRITQAEIDEIIQIAKDMYNYDPGNVIPSMPVDDEKLLVKLDWNINDAHRASFVYNYNDGFSMAQSDASSSRISLSNHFYERGAELKSYVTSIYSDWTDDLSTEFRLGKSELDNRQISIDRASGFGEFQIRTAGGATVYLGPDDSRQANKLSYENLSFKAAATYYLDDHQFLVGYEYEDLDVFNMFIQHNEGEHRFGSVEEFRSGFADRVYYGNARSHNPADAAGLFKYAIHTFYAQDEYYVADYDLTLTFGLRYEKYESDDVPALNQNFVDRYGFSNQQNLDGKDLLQPRFGFNWAVDDALSVRGGFGLFSGGNPNVWISNSYSNDGIRNIQERINNVQLLGPDAVEFVGGGRAGYDIPLDLYNTVGSGTADSSTNVTDPNFEIPSEWKFSLGLTYLTEDDYTLTADLLISDKQDSAVIRDLALEQVATAPDGRPIYDSVNHPRNSDFLLTNVEGDDDARSTILSFSIDKRFDNGFRFTASYAYTEAEDVHPMTSSVAFSNYHNIAVADSQNPVLSRSNYEIPHRFTLNLNYTMELFEGYDTKFTLFGQANEGSPYDYSFISNFVHGFNDRDRQLLYIPAENDPNVVYGDDFNVGVFNDWIASEGLDKYRGQIMPRNALDSDWWVKFDFRVEQEFPGFYEDHKGSAFMVIKNVGNFLDEDWGILRTGSRLQGCG